MSGLYHCLSAWVAARVMFPWLPLKTATLPGLMNAPSRQTIQPENAIPEYTVSFITSDRLNLYRATCTGDYSYPNL